MDTTPSPQTNLKKNAFGVPSILFFVFSAQAPLTGIVGAAGLAVALGNGAGAPSAYLAVGLVIVLFAVGFTTVTRTIDAHGGFFAVIRAGLGQRVGTSGSLLALLSYNTVQFAMYGLLGASLSSLLANDLGLHLPWWLGALAAIALVWFLGSRNVELGAKVLAVLVSLEFLLLSAFAVGVIVTKGLGALNVAGSFSPGAFFYGAPGVAVMFAIASMFGFESTAIYAAEAKDPHRTVPRATYISVIIIAVFFALVIWMLIVYYGSANAQPAALDVLSTDPTQFVLQPLNAILGPWAGSVAQILLCTSLLAGVQAFHNMITRYFHALAEHHVFPHLLARTNRHQAPWIAAITQTILAVAGVAAFAIPGLDPITNLFTWFSGLAVLALVVLYVLSSVAIPAYFRRHPAPYPLWQTLIAPALATLCMAAVLWMVIDNFDALVGGNGPVMWTLLITVPTVAVIGLLIRQPTSRTNGPTDRKPTAEAS
ncbi:amino acid permease [Mycobacterium sp. 852013-50091_SCH5140682]|nr:amino acid permease [Mycobacterium sp. 852013-50091_SCH5140682]